MSPQGSDSFLDKWDNWHKLSWAKGIPSKPHELEMTFSGEYFIFECPGKSGRVVHKLALALSRVRSGKYVVREFKRRHYFFTPEDLPTVVTCREPVTAKLPEPVEFARNRFFFRVSLQKYNIE